MLFKTRAPKGKVLSQYFLCNADVVSGVIKEIDESDFSQKFLAFDSGRKTSCLLQKCKIMYENIVLSFFQTKLNKS